MSLEDDDLLAVRLERDGFLSIAILPNPTCCWWVCYVFT